MVVKICYLYVMGSRLVNVRLDEERLWKARRLREDGLALSTLVREAIDERFDQVSRTKTSREIRDVINCTFNRYPDPAGIPPRTYDAHDRKAARDAINRKLRRRAE
jgi:hypothetical protein